MKKSFLIITAIILIIIFIVLGYIFEAQSKQKEAISYNKQYENYLGKEIYGAEIATLINKVIEQNQKNEIPKDENGYYIENDTNSIKIEVKFLESDKTFNMETISVLGADKFIKNYSKMTFKCTKIEYHKKTNNIKYMLFEQI